MSEIVFWMVDKKKMLHKFTNWFVRIWRHISNQHLQQNTKFHLSWIKRKNIHHHYINFVMDCTIHKNCNMLQIYKSHLTEYLRMHLPYTFLKQLKILKLKHVSKIKSHQWPNHFSLKIHGINLTVNWSGRRCSDARKCSLIAATISYSLFST